MAKITWLEPYDTVRGKFSKKSNLINKLAGILHEQIAHRQGKRSTPVSAAESSHREEFALIAKNVAKRRRNDSETYEQDVALFMAQKNQPGGYSTFQKWLFHDEMDKL